MRKSFRCISMVLVMSLVLAMVPLNFVNNLGMDNVYASKADIGTGNGVKAVAAGYAHTVVLKEDGTVVAWGSNLYGQCIVPSGLTNVKKK